MKKLLIPILMIFFGKSFAQNQEKFVLESKDLGEVFTSKFVYNRYNCGGQNFSPELHWKNAPANTKSFAITLFDPDAPTGHGWWHWLIFNIPANTNYLPTGAGSKFPELLPQQVVQSINDYGELGYGGPCPPKGHGPHHYIFTIYALDTAALNLPPDTAPKIVNQYIQKHSIAHTSFTSIYER